MRLLRENAIGIVIDIQEKLFPHMHEKDTFIKNTTRLIEGLKILGLPILISEQYTKGLGPTIPEVQHAINDYLPLEKISFSCCDEPDFEDKLDEFAKPVAIICGIEAHVCVMQTAIDMIKKGFTVMVVEDCITSRKLNDKNIAVQRMLQENALISTYESILFELCRVADGDEFKAVSKLVK
jgi:nicotinamidase-related amidase